MYLSTIFEIKWYNFISGDTIFTITQYLFWFDSNVKDVALFGRKKNKCDDFFAAKRFTVV